jgi:hypothetical protein
MIRVYEAKLTEYSIPVEETGFKPIIASKAAGGVQPTGMAATF